VHLESQGSWIVRQSVGSTPCLLGKAVDITYIRGANYLEVRWGEISEAYVCLLFSYEIGCGLGLT